MTGPAQKPAVSQRAVWTAGLTRRRRALLGPGRALCRQASPSAFPSSGQPRCGTVRGLGRRTVEREPLTSWRSEARGGGGSDPLWPHAAWSRGASAGHQTQDSLLLPPTRGDGGSGLEHRVRTPGPAPRARVRRCRGQGLGPERAASSGACACGRNVSLAAPAGLRVRGHDRLHSAAGANMPDPC